MHQYCNKCYMFIHRIQIISVCKSAPRAFVLVAFKTNRQHCKRETPAKTSFVLVFIHRIQTTSPYIKYSLYIEYKTQVRTSNIICTMSHTIYFIQVWNEHSKLDKGRALQPVSLSRCMDINTQEVAIRYGSIEAGRESTTPETHEIW